MRSWRQVKNRANLRSNFKATIALMTNEVDTRVNVWHRGARLCVYLS
jgi:hypothetical protein